MGRSLGLQRCQEERGASLEASVQRRALGWGREGDSARRVLGGGLEGGSARRVLGGGREGGRQAGRRQGWRRPPLCRLLPPLHLPAPPPPSEGSLPPSQPAFLFEQVAFENFKHTLSFRGSKPQQFRLAVSSFVFVPRTQGLCRWLPGDGWDAGVRGWGWGAL